MTQPELPTVLDRDHLDRMTLGDAALAAEILRLFAVQSATLVHHISNNPAGGGLSAHKLKGSARAVGALALNAAVTAFEQSLAEAADTTATISALKRSSADVLCAIEAYFAEPTASSSYNASRAGVGRIEPL